MVDNFNEWRDQYDLLTFDEHVKYHNLLEGLYPDQAHYDLNAFKQALEIVKPLTIFEAGCWKADLAATILAENPDIVEWVGFELSTSAIAKTKCTDPRFVYHALHRFDWWRDIDLSCDLFVATHFIEHLSNKHFLQLIDAINARYIYFEAPLTAEGNEWHDFVGTHKLTLGWDDIVKRMPETYSITDTCKLFRCA